ncbi:MAG: TlpA disulfide reductase family protein [Sulfuricaulis sp.]|nr:TlpA disulfide reductase family protein [Sulfuricaulis sp.]
MKSETVRNLVLLAAALAALVAGYFAAVWLRAPATDTASGGMALEFKLPDLAGTPRSLSEWRGQVVVLNFWATWCPPCREEIPLFIDLQKRHGRDGLQFLGVAIDRQEDVVSYVAEIGMNYPTLLGDDNAIEIMRAYGNRTGSLPYSVIIGRDGQVVARKLGAFRGQELESLLTPLLFHNKAPKY